MNISGQLANRNRGAWNLIVRSIPLLDIGKLQELAARTLVLVRGDAGLYLFVLCYTIAGLLFLQAAGASDKAAYAIYLPQWTTWFLFLMPALAILLDSLRVIHRFSARRRLAFKRMFSVERLAQLFAGICLLMGMMIFQGTFTSVKNGLPVLYGGFPYDRAQADLDAHLHFGTDPWRWLFDIAANDTVRDLVEWNYNVLWFVLCFSTLFFVATSPRARSIRTRYLVCFMLVWIVVGNLFAGVFLSAGPAFYGAVTGDEFRFARQLEFLAGGANGPHSAVSYQHYLWSLYETGKPGFGSGISAFPSVHVGLITMNALFLWERSRRVGAIAFAYVAFICASSVYLAWHYAIDGYAAIAIVVAIYLAVRELPDRFGNYTSRLTASREGSEAIAS